MKNRYCRRSSRMAPRSLTILGAREINYQRSYRWMIRIRALSASSGEMIWEGRSRSSGLLITPRKQDSLVKEETEYRNSKRYRLTAETRIKAPHLIASLRVHPSSPMRRQVPEAGSPLPTSSRQHRQPWLFTVLANSLIMPVLAAPSATRTTWARSLPVLSTSTQV